MCSKQTGALLLRFKISSEINTLHPHNFGARNYLRTATTVLSQDAETVLILYLRSSSDLAEEKTSHIQCHLSNNPWKHLACKKGTSTCRDALSVTIIHFPSYLTMNLSDCVKRQDDM